jgi:hypothetical protein
VVRRPRRGAGREERHCLVQMSRQRSRLRCCYSAVPELPGAAYAQLRRVRGRNYPFNGRKRFQVSLRMQGMWA